MLFKNFYKIMTAVIFTLTIFSTSLFANLPDKGELLLPKIDPTLGITKINLICKLESRHKLKLMQKKLVSWISKEGKKSFNCWLNSKMQKVDKVTFSLKNLNYQLKNIKNKKTLKKLKDILCYKLEFHITYALKKIIIVKTVHLFNHNIPSASIDNIFSYIKVSKLQKKLFFDKKKKFKVGITSIKINISENNSSKSFFIINKRNFQNPFFYIFNPLNSIKIKTTIKTRKYLTKKDQKVSKCRKKFDIRKEVFIDKYDKGKAPDKIEIKIDKMNYMKYWNEKYGKI